MLPRALGSVLQLFNILLALIQNLATASGTSPWIGTTTEMTGQLTHQARAAQVQGGCLTIPVSPFFRRV